MSVGAINTVIIYPNVFNDHPEYLGLIQIIIAYAIVISIFSSLGMPKTFMKILTAEKPKPLDTPCSKMRSQFLATTKMPFL